MRWLPAPCALAVLLAAPTTAWAGMPSFDLTDVATLRLRAISFFLLVFLASAKVVQALWNWLRADFPALPRLGYGRAVGLLGVWGLLFLLVLTMISGARELMTPGAWKKQGATYVLADDPDAGRRARLEALRAALWAHAARHDGLLPADDRTADVPAAAWRVVDDPRAARFEYAPGARAGLGDAPVAWEPRHFGATRWVLLSSGEVVQRRASDLAPAPVGAHAR